MKKYSKKLSKNRHVGIRDIADDPKPTRLNTL